MMKYANLLNPKSKGRSIVILMLCIVSLCFGSQLWALDSDRATDDGYAPLKLKLRPLVEINEFGPTKYAARCPLGTILTPYDMPIYDEETGLFVVGYETVWFCLPEDLEPAG